MNIAIFVGSGNENRNQKAPQDFLRRTIGWVGLSTSVGDRCMCHARVATVVSAARPLGAVSVVNTCKGLRSTSLLNVPSPGESSGNLLRRHYGLEVDVQPCRYFSCRHDIAFFGSTTQCGQTALCSSSERMQQVRKKVKRGRGNSIF